MTLAVTNLSKNQENLFLNSFKVFDFPKYKRLRKRSKTQEDTPILQSGLSEATINPAQIQQEFEQIKEVWLKGYNLEKKEIRDFDYSFEGLQRLNDFIEKYWDYFIPEDKAKLEKYARELKRNDNSNFLISLIRAILEGKSPKIIRFIHKYVEYSKTHPNTRILEKFKQYNQRFSNSILDFTKQDLEKERLKNSWEDESEIFDVILENIEESLNENYSKEELQALEKIQKKLARE